MAAEKASALVLRTTDWSESSRIATLWTREFGKIRVLAKGGRRLKSAFETALDLLTVCSIVFLRKSSGLDLLTEAQVVQRFPRLRQHLPALYGGYYVAELLADWTQDYDPHPPLFDAALSTLNALGPPAAYTTRDDTSLTVMRFEMQLLCELGYRPGLDQCADCGQPWVDDAAEVRFSVARGGILCGTCRGADLEAQRLSVAGLQLVRDLMAPGEAWQQAEPGTTGEVRRVLGQYVTYLLGRRPRLLSYLERGT